MTILNQESSMILIIDVQERLLNAVFNMETIEKKSAILAQAAAILGLPVFVTEQYPKGLGPTIGVIRESLDKNNTVYFEKTSFNAVFDTNILSALKQTKRNQVILFGIETHICVHQTVAALIENGFSVHVIKDACSSRAQEEHLTGLSRMKDNGAHITTSEIALFELLKSSDNPKFKEVQALIKQHSPSKTVLSD